MSAFSVAMKKAGLDINSVPVRDATADVVVKITKADLRRAERKNPNMCVMARAACRSVPNVSDAYFWKSAAYLHIVHNNGKEELLKYTPSTAAAKEIEAFDARGAFTEGAYILHAPKGSRTSGAISNRSKKRPGRHKPGTTRITRRMKGSLRANWAEITS